ncbi:unnamed protein product [[Candida] boidinii]|nr:unnamed protein product [[Candida] boidinii]
MNDEATEISKLTINDFDAEGELVRPISHISTLSSAIPADNEEEEEGDSSSLTDESFDSMELAPRLLTEKKPRSNSNNTTHSKVSFKSNHTITSINSNNNKNSNELSRSLSKNSKMSKMSKISTKQQSHIQKPLISFTPIAKIPSARIHNDDYYHLSRNISNTASSVRHRSTGNHQTHSENASISMNQDDPTIDTIDTALDTESSLPPTSLKGLATRHTHTNTNPLVQPLTKIKSNATDKKSIRSFGSIRSITHTVTNAFSGSGSEADETHSYPGNDNYNDDDDDDDDINSLDSRLIAAPTMTEALVREYSRVEPYNRNIPTSIAIATETNLSKKDIEKSGENIPFIKKYKLNWLVFLLKNFLKPNSVVLIVSLAIALIPWTKALFVETKTYIPNAPDGQPPLSFILQYTEYLGQPCVPVFGNLL